MERHCSRWAELIDCRQLLAGMFLTLVVLPLNAADVWPISHAIPGSQLLRAPNTLTFLIYDREYALQPVQEHSFDLGDWQSDLYQYPWPIPEEKDVEFRVLLRNMGQFAESTLLWAELDIDGTTTGKRFRVLPEFTGYCADGQAITEVSALGSISCGVKDSAVDHQTYHFMIDSEGDVGGSTSIAIGLDGHPVISYYDISNNDLKFARCNDVTCSSATVSTLDASGDVGDYTSIAIGADGYPVISYHDDTNKDLKLANCNDTVCSGVAIRTLVSEGRVGMYNSIAIGTDGFPVISFCDWGRKDLRVAKCNDADCTDVIVNTVDSAGDTGYDTSIAIGADSFPVISYYDRTYGGLKVAKCGDAACSSASIITYVALSESHGWNAQIHQGMNSSIAIGSDGFPVVSFGKNAGSVKLHVLKCGDPSCGATASITNMDSTTNIGSHTSIAIGADGLPVIAYHFTSGVLVVAKCTNMSCGNATLTKVDLTDDIGEDASIAIGTDGMPVISHYNSTSHDLMVTKCGKPDCGSP